MDVATTRANMGLWPLKLKQEFCQIAKLSFPEQDELQHMGYWALSDAQTLSDEVPSATRRACVCQVPTMLTLLSHTWLP